jgi:DNA replication protein DnaC
MIFQDEYNHSQKKAICVAAKLSLEPAQNRRICLIQGPPGTGKSHTIVGIIKRIFKVSSMTSKLFINHAFFTRGLLF